MLGKMPGISNRVKPYLGYAGLAENGVSGFSPDDKNGLKPETTFCHVAAPRIGLFAGPDNPAAGLGHRVPC